MQILMDEVEKLLELLYQENEEQSYNQLVAIIPQLEQEIQKMTDAELQQQTMQGLLLVMQAMEAGDLTLLADYLKYEVIERILGA
ncbi:MAG: hypothetical protein Q4D51_00515 [Eubacteriales bacterium]|nr:hypothetical protein [Eubacteriales bacterium]